ncbi:MAG TPA: nitroreductase family protein, partial [Geobacterales bacterium]|nr:nitroreductase family protein [Geobacterales bacterium]
PVQVITEILEAARYTGSGKNLQHWRFVVIQDRKNIEKLAEDSITGKWAINGTLAILVLTDPSYDFHLLDAGRVVQNMQLVAWSHGIASGLFTRFDIEKLRRDFNIPEHLYPSAAVIFGYPPRKIIGKKARRPLRLLVFSEKFGEPFFK